MSHFTVMIVGDNWEEQLAPYQENNMGDCPQEFLEFNEVGDEYSLRYENEKTTAVRLPSGKLANIYSYEAREIFKDGVPEDQKIEISFKELYGDFDTFMTEYAEYKKDPTTGKYGDWENPNVKWDWYSLGGRWTGFFPLKPGVEGNVGRPGLMTDAAPEGYADQCRKRDIDIKRLRDEAGQKAAEQFDKLEPAFKGQQIPSWDAIREKHSGNIDSAREEWRSNPVIAAMEKIDVWSTTGNGDLAQHYCNGDRDKFIERARQQAIQTFAVLKDGKWYERGRMGWWGAVSDAKDDWDEEFSRLINDLPEDTLLSIVDCHI